MTTPEMKFTERWKEHLSNFKDTARKIDGEPIQFTYHIFLGAKTIEILLNSDEWI